MLQTSFYITAAINAVLTLFLALFVLTNYRLAVTQKSVAPQSLVGCYQGKIETTGGWPSLRVHEAKDDTLLVEFSIESPNVRTAQKNVLDHYIKVACVEEFEFWKTHFKDGKRIK